MKLTIIKKEIIEYLRKSRTNLLLWNILYDMMRYLPITVIYDTINYTNHVIRIEAAAALWNFSPLHENIKFYFLV